MLEWNARIINLVHDAIVFEAKPDDVVWVAGRVSRLLEDAVQERFPQLKPRSVCNTADRSCWNKDGDAAAFDRWAGGAT